MEHPLTIGTGYDDGNEIIKILATVMGLLRYNVVDVSSVSYEYDHVYVFDLVFDSNESLVMFSMKYL